MKRWFFALGVLLAACGCPAAVVDPDVGIGQNVAALCKRECAALAKLGCEEAKPTRGGMTCQDVCVAAAEVGAPPVPGCVEQAKNCECAGKCRTKP